MKNPPVSPFVKGGIEGGFGRGKMSTRQRIVCLTFFLILFRGYAGGVMENKTEPFFAWYLYGVDTAPVLSLEVPASAPSLPEGLIIRPGIYRVHDRIYNLEREGLYRFIRPGQDNRQCIVYRGDIEALLSALCWIHSHGSRDDSGKFEELKVLASKEKLIMTCGPYSNFTHRLLEEQGIKSRVVASRALYERNGYDDGHVLIEVYLDGRWVLCDIDQHVFFTNMGRRLSLLDLSLKIPSGDYRLEHLASSMPLAVSSFKEDGYDWGLWMETAIHSEETLRRWYGRIMMLPVISDAEGSFCAGNEKDRAGIERLWPGLKFLTVDEFRKRFYSD